LNPPRPRQLSLFTKIVLSTSIAITLLLGLAGWFARDQTRSVLLRNLQSELESSFGAYESLWQSRAATLRSVSLVLSGMSDVRAAFQTNDRATIKDTAAEVWARVSQSNALFLVTDPAGEVIASLGGGEVLGNHLDVVREAAPRFPAQTDGFALENGRLYELVVTPVYVQTVDGQGLLNVLVAGFPIDETVARDLGKQTAGDFVFTANGATLASTLPAAQSERIARQYQRSPNLQRLDLADGEFAVLGTTLRNIEGAPVGDLLTVRSFDTLRRDLDALQRKLVLVWAAAILAGLALSGFLAHRILKPIRQLDDAAARIARQEYSTRVPEGGKEGQGSNDELGRLARTFNSMCSSIQEAREELIRQERISTIGRLSSSIVHDLRNPLASIYGGAEMIMDGHLSAAQLRRVASNVYRSSRAINDLLQELVDVSRGRTRAPELCRLSEVVAAAVETQAGAAEQQGVRIESKIDPSIELPLERARIERVFLNLIGNALEAMPGGGCVEISAERDGDSVTIGVDDTGPGIPPSVRRHLFQPFVSERKNGLGLGLALSRQTVLDHGGDLWIAETESSGARFRLRLPCQFS
jgi:signal transduction histidine kinase